ncbi:RBBP9/YdeN family alpha/beta hydrolase [Chitinophaga varians]|uniref:RBBP9/YdeN family alpha/beta hydrolase n=1 Tax=Chitinophaga varians TaxID=2202339 RepID=UPI00165F9656|nr:alpha/beta fold hydrolase [Chitinophaga varians]MBC9913130.1 serine hydrolase family protein [Chitinophaga varians]
MEIKVLTAPGLGSSGPLHWQTLWEQSIPGTRRIEQHSWDRPVCADWVATIEAAVAEAGPQVVVAAHSLACIALAHWAKQTRLHITGALLVAPADTERPGFPAEATGFTPIPLQELPFRSIVVASTNDEYCGITRASFLASHWGSRFVNAGPKGHINASSNLGEWLEGQRLLKELVQNWPTL